MHWCNWASVLVHSTAAFSLLQGCSDVEQEVLRLDQLHQAGWGSWRIPGVHPVPHDPGQRPHERDSPAGHRSVPHHHECSGLSSELLKAAVQTIISDDNFATVIFQLNEMFSTFLQCSKIVVIVFRPTRAPWSPSSWAILQTRQERFEIHLMKKMASSYRADLPDKYLGRL